MKEVEDNSIKIDDFKLGRKLGAGKFGEVFIARHKKSGFMCAIKRINKLNIDQKLLIQLIREIKIQSFLTHPNIVKLYTFFCDHQFIYLVLELCYSGQLYDYLKKKRKLSEPLTKNIVQQSLKALDYMHEN
jgi:aurora kinase